MKLAVVAVVAALGVGAAHGGGDDERGQTSDPRAGQGGDETKGYGYGEQPGREAEGARQSGSPARATSKAPQLERAEPGAKTPEMVGHVVEVGKGTLSIRRDDGKVERLRVTKDTRILRDGQRVALSTIAPGTEVRAGLAGGKSRVATRIDVGGGEAGTNAPLIDGRPQGAEEPKNDRRQGERE